MAKPEGQNNNIQNTAEARRNLMRQRINPHLAAAINGDENAQGELFRAILPGITRYVSYSWPKDYPPIDVDDVVQNTFVSIYNALPTFDDKGQGADAFLNFSYTTARRRMYDAARSRSRDRTDRDAEYVDAPYEEDFHLPPESREMLKAALAKLPQGQREVIALTILSGFDAEAAAKVLGKSAGSVRVAQHRGLKGLQRAIPPDELDKYRRLLGGRPSGEEEPVRDQEQEGPERDVPVGPEAPDDTHEPEEDLDLAPPALFSDPELGYDVDYNYGRTYEDEQLTGDEPDHTERDEEPERGRQEPRSRESFGGEIVPPTRSEELERNVPDRDERDEPPMPEPDIDK